MADKFLVQAKRFPSISWQNYGASAFGDDTERAVYRALSEGFSSAPVICVSGQSLSQQPFGLVAALSGISKRYSR
ncbi:hypothetical protein KCP71_16825 [Salmonella enterica subsp. enterica]|nr:hypothetical protein KCP71_16825 [Salmonella enterica subsp. enterica]